MPPSSVTGPSNQSSPETSTVSKHVALWVILAIITNTMAQFAAVNGDNTLYYHASPLFSLIESIRRLPLAITYHCVLRNETVSFIQALQLTYTSVDELPISINATEQSNQAPSKTWPRWLFFVFGPLPATIKLCSFRGVPWIQTLGLMSVASFVLNELYLVIAGSNASQHAAQQILNLTDEEWHDDHHQKLVKTLHSIRETRALINILLSLVFGILNFVIVLYAAIQIRSLVDNWINDENSPTANYADWFLPIFIKVINYTAAFSMSIPLLAAGPLHDLLRLPTIKLPDFLDHFNASIRIMMASTVTVNLPQRAKDQSVKPKSKFGRVMDDFNGAFFLPAVVMWCLFYVTRWCVRMWPRMGKALFLVKEEIFSSRKEIAQLKMEPAKSGEGAINSKEEASDSTKEVADSKDEAHSSNGEAVDSKEQSGLSKEEASHLREETVGPIEDASTKKEEIIVIRRGEKEVEEKGARMSLKLWMGLCFFLVHLIVAVLWFECAYDEAGTINPSWTEVFG